MTVAAPRAACENDEDGDENGRENSAAPHQNAASGNWVSWAPSGPGQSLRVTTMWTPPPYPVMTGGSAPQPLTVRVLPHPGYPQAPRSPSLREERLEAARRPSGTRYASFVRAALALAVCAASLGAAGPTRAQQPPSGGCGVRLALLIDTSNSIYSAGQDNPAKVRAAARSFVEALAGTPSVVTVFNFRGHTTQDVPPTNIGDAESYSRVLRGISTMPFDTVGFGASGGGTNWESALKAAERAHVDIALLITDGSPTAYGTVIDSHPLTGSFEFDPSALAAALQVSERLKAAGTRIIAVGVGDIREETLPQVSGPEKGKDYFVGDFNALTALLGSVASSLCPNRVVVETLVDKSPAGASIVSLRERGAAVQSPFDQSRTAGSDGLASFEVPAGANDRSRQLTLTVVPASGATVVGVSCTRNGQPLSVLSDLVRGRVDLDLQSRDSIRCTVDERTGPSLSPEVRNRRGHLWWLVVLLLAALSGAYLVYRRRRRLRAGL